uniref:Uncharacterized protein n=1 Tax=Octopus bimaculoides TaxID=37653 RepID=A0A0L8GM27_OCTBM
MVDLRLSNRRSNARGYNYMLYWAGNNCKTNVVVIGILLAEKGKDSVFGLIIIRLLTKECNNYDISMCLN